MKEELIGKSKLIKNNEAHFQSFNQLSECPQKNLKKTPGKDKMAYVPRTHTL